MSAPTPQPQAAEKTANIQIEASPAGLIVRFEYVGALGSIPAAIERLKAAGVLDLVSASRPAPAPTNGDRPARKAAQPRVEPIYQPDGAACCPVHKKTLAEGRYGLYCPAKAKDGEQQNDKGYCSLKFAE